MIVCVANKMWFAIWYSHNVDFINPHLLALRVVFVHLSMDAKVMPKNDFLFFLLCFDLMQS